FAMLYRMAASVMSLLWIGYLIFNERLYSEKMTNVHVRCSLICALLFISYPMWMNGIHAGIAADMLATGFVVSQCFFLINLVRGWQYAKTGPEDEGLTK
ncbi:MAG TPA: hypothetical protein VHK69_14160, partial [Chitinophagaceae bacterium]|nr:hypothetical protein [Chitinophagaceae bacterium]